MNLQPYFITSTLLLLASLVSCKESDKRKEVGQNGLIEVAVQYSKHYSEYTKASRLLQDNKFLEAISIYKKLCSVEDDSLRTYAYLGLGSAYLMSNDYQNALESYNKSNKLNSKNVNVYVGLGSVYFRLGDYKKAVEYYGYAKSVDSSAADSYWGLALSYDKLEMADSAKANAKHFIHLEPHSNYRSLAESIINK